MSNYTKATDFAAKDALSTGNAAKRVKGTEIDAEFVAVGTAIATKADLISPTFTGTPLAPTAAAGTSTAQIATTAFVLAEIPSGIIVMWSGSIATVPSGWYLCNGSNSTPDLRDKFIIGAYSDSAGVASTTITGGSTSTGGSKDAVAVTHNHTLTDPGHIHNYYSGGGSAGERIPVADGDGNGRDNTLNTSSATTGMSIAAAGESGTNKNLPPYYALAFIMKA